MPSAGFEPTTYRLGGDRSILLSYEGEVRPHLVEPMQSLHTHRTIEDAALEALVRIRRRSDILAQGFSCGANLRGRAVTTSECPAQVVQAAILAGYAEGAAVYKTAPVRTTVSDVTAAGQRAPSKPQQQDPFVVPGRSSQIRRGGSSTGRCDPVQLVACLLGAMVPRISPIGPTRCAGSRGKLLAREASNVAR